MNNSISFDINTQNEGQILAQENKIESSKSPWFRTLFYEPTIFFACDNTALANEAEKYKDASWLQKFAIGFKKGSVQLITMVAFGQILNFAFNNLPEGVSATSSGVESLAEVISTVALEEILFRGILQNGVGLLQKGVSYLAPRCLQNNRVFQWLTSPSARILTANSLFALAHLDNTGTYLSQKQTIMQVTRILLFPKFSILYETSGSILTPFGAHLANNLIVNYL